MKDSFKHLVILLATTLSTCLILVLAASTQNGEESSYRIFGRRLRVSPRREQEIIDSILGPQGLVSGSVAKATDFPWYAKFEGNVLCGGTVVGNGQFILTAAHCVDGYTPPQVRVGSSLWNAGGTLYQVTRKWKHPNFNRGALENDVALLKILTTCLPTPVSAKLNNDPTFPSTTGTPLTVIGFGRTRDGGDTSNFLQRLDVDYIAESECLSGDPLAKLCADKDGAGSCQGDSGSPIISSDTKAVVGVVSYGIDGCASSHPDYYARVSTYVDWIESTMAAEMALPQPGSSASLFSSFQRSSNQWLTTKWYSLFEEP